MLITFAVSISCSPLALPAQPTAAALDDTALHPTSAPLPPGPQEVRIPVSSGRELAGWYFPAEQTSAPIVVLMHWAGGNHWDWDVIARWLQNRDNQVPGVAGTLWSDPYWFPPIPDDASFAVLTFNYASVPMDPSHSGIVDHFPSSLAAVTFASQLDGVDPYRILTIGASIGADSAPEACYLFNGAVAAGEEIGQCVGALSFSPASEDLYADAARQLLEQDALVYCFGAIGDTQAERGCRQPSHENYRSFIYTGGAHGYYLIDPTLFPTEPPLEKNALQLMLEFLEQASRLPLSE